MSHFGPRGRRCDSSSEKASCIKQMTKKNRGKSPISVPLSVLEQFYFSSHKSREEFYLGVRNTVLLKGAFMCH